MDKLFCSICEREIADEEYEELGNGYIACQECATECCKRCENCEELFCEEDLIEEDDKYYCESCHDELFAECYICGKMTLKDDLQFWGDVEICPDCMEERCPSFDEAENEDDTTEAYEAMLKKYVGRKSQKERSRTVDLIYEFGDEVPYRYEISVTLDAEGKITDISRLIGCMLLSESERSSDWEPVAIDDEDYEDIAEYMLEELELEDEEVDEE